MQIIKARHILVVFFSSLSWAQFGPPPGAGAESRALAPPLSGRAAVGGAVAQQTPVPGRTTSVNTLSTTIQVQGAFQGSGATEPLSGKLLTLREAIGRGLQFNLGTVSVEAARRQAGGQSMIARSALLPNLNGAVRETVQQTNLRAFGLRFPGVPGVVGPFNYFDLRATLTQSLFDLTALKNYRSAREQERAIELSLRDARETVVLAVAGAYLQTVAAQARLRSAEAQLKTAEALLRQAVERRQGGLIPQIDVNRHQVDVQVQRQRVASLENDLAKAKLNLARLIGLAPGAEFRLADDPPFSALNDLSVEKAVEEAFVHRADLKAAQALVAAAEQARLAARAERYPSLAITTDYGVIGVNPAQAHGTVNFTGSLRLPIFNGGRTEGAIQQAEAALLQRKAELEDLKGRIESEVRSAFLDLRTAAQQVEVARQALRVAEDNVKLVGERFESGVSESVELVQAQEAVANAELDVISSVFAHNVAKLALARALGRAEELWSDYLGVK